MESLDENQELVVVVQIEEPTTPTCEQTLEDYELTDNKFTVTIEEEECNPDAESHMIEQISININKTDEQQSSKEAETAFHEDNVNLETNPPSNTKIISNSDNIQTFHNETNRKRAQELQNAVAQERRDTSSDINKKRKVELFTDIKGPEWYNVRGNLVTRSIISKNLPALFEPMPIYGRPENTANLEKFYSGQLREFIGPDIDNDEFEELAKYCSPEHLKTGQELVLKSSLPSQGILSTDEIPEMNETKANLSILNKCKIRMEKDVVNNYPIKLKYRGVRLLPWIQENDKDFPLPESDVLLEPGKDILYRIRIYRPYTYHVSKERCTRGRHSVFSCDMMAVGRLPLSALRDRIVCNNDIDMRVDVSDAPDTLPPTTAKEAFPSGFLLINNTFYVDFRPGCKDHSRIIREWAVGRGMGEFHMKDMSAVCLDDIVVRLGYPEVYVHQGSCEHVFTFSDIRILSSSDPLRLSSYPRHSAVSQNQTVYCTTCAEFGAKWVVVGCARVPFDPAFFCETCFKQYLYIDGVKIGDFKAYSYRGNETNTLKPCG